MANKSIEPSPALFVYSATVLRVIDGDTFVAVVDLGFRVSLEVTVRILGVDAPEKTKSTKKLGLAAGEALRAKFLGSAGRVKVQSTSVDSFGRALCRVWTIDDENVGEWMIRRGYAVEAWR